MNNLILFYALFDVTTQQYYWNMGTDPEMTLYHWKTSKKLPPLYARIESLAAANETLVEVQEGVAEAIEYAENDDDLCKAELSVLRQLKAVEMTVVKVSIDTRVDFC
jgi:hypothetical protein